MGRLFKKIAVRLLAGLSVVVILLALALGAFRLLISRLPSYQSELQAWVSEQLDLDIEFDELDARLGLAGPELTLHGATIGIRDSGRSFLAARRAGVAIDPWSLLFDWRVAASRLTVDGVLLTVERTPSGSLRLAGSASESALDLAALVPPTVEVVVRDSQLLYIDLARRRSWQFLDVALALSRDDTGLAVTANAQAPAELAQEIDLRLEADLAADRAIGAAHLTGRLTNLDLGVLARLLPTEQIVDMGGSGDLAFEVEWAGERIVRAQVAADIVNVALGAWSGGANDLFDRIALDAEWSRLTDRSWQLALADVEVVRDEQAWEPGGDSTFLLERGDGGDIGRLELESDFVKLDDIEPLIAAIGDERVAELWAELDPHGSLNGLDLTVERAGDAWEYAVATQFEQLAFDRTGRLPGIVGLDGELRADTRNGTVVLDSGPIGLDWPLIFRTDLTTESLSGTVVWREGRDGLRVIGNDLRAEVLGEPLTASLELSLPADGASPHLDLDAHLTSIDLIEAKRFLPTPHMPDSVVEWLDESVQGGVGSDIRLNFFGPVSEFPFDRGGGQFSVVYDVADATLEFVQDWPRAVGLDGHIEFVNAGFSARGDGRVLGSRATGIEVDIPNMRSGLMTIATRADGPLGDVLDFVNQSPVIARHLGSRFERLRAGAGRGVTGIDLNLPLRDLDSYTLHGDLTLIDGELAIEGFAPSATEINGELHFDNATVTSESIEGVFLGGPVAATVGPSETPDYRSEITFEGETAASAILDSFSLPYDELFGGQTRWSGRLTLPSTSIPAAPPMRVDIESNLSGIVMRLPQPVTKSASEPLNLQVSFVFAADRLEVTGNLGATRRFVLDYAQDADRFQFRRGGITFGGAEPALPALAGISASGRLPSLDVNQWLDLGRSIGVEGARPLFLDADLDVAEFHAYGQHLGSTQFEVHRLDRVWVVDVDSEAVSGRITVPRDLSLRAPIVAEMDRVYLAANDSASLSADPRELPGLRLRAAEFGVGTRRLGRVEASVVADPRGLRLESFSSQSDSYRAEGGGSWFSGPQVSVTRVDASIHSTNVGATLTEFGIHPAIEGELGDITASVSWEGAPSSGWLDHLNGDVTLHIETGTLVDIDPGAGRVVGLMSIAALPRRLALDFRDVFKEGFAFDEITGKFMIIDGDAYTNDLLMTGPTADIGLIGRTGLRDRDFQQQAVITSEPGNMLPTVGAVLGGVGVGAVLLIFTQIFKEPLKGIGRAAYCVSGPWDDPIVDRLDREERRNIESCVELPPELTEVIDE